MSRIEGKVQERNMEEKETCNTPTTPSRQQVLVILDQLNRARLLQEMVNTPPEKRHADNLFNQCYRWLQHNNIQFYYDETEHLYLLVVPHKSKETTSL
ncbi:hypothetical protein EPA93_33670 [Ktedonosporobacter rubrisoli]|uniref:Uncharacterized protein n=1 Tax=Ktedonosporobacter rubrisoli TaxID=2509675 RepID=A0A4P6JXZ7_KTERU|nr:hypothetical protein [Ktedonosporobacter rubrisoli]QBD80657.1 hypothetical protein EPA93_33670 [Ktedonosporobacter rubrisoli]